MLGRTTAGTGPSEEITVGGNLTLSAGSINLAAAPTVTTQAVGTNNTTVATTAYIGANTLGHYTTAITDVVGSRVVNVSYTNSSGKPMFVQVTADVSVNGSALYGLVNAAIVDICWVNTVNAAGYILSVCMIVPPGSSYQIQLPLGNATLRNVWEYN
jgi:hypothetical protein